MVIFNVFVCIFITGRFIQTDLRLFDCEVKDRRKCQLTLFDLIKDDPDNISVNYDSLRTGRCGTALIVSGIYLIFVGLRILIPDTTD